MMLWPEGVVCYLDADLFKSSPWARVSCDELCVDGVGDGVGGEEVCEYGGQGVWALLVTSLRYKQRENYTQFGLDTANQRGAVRLKCLCVGL